MSDLIKNMEAKGYEPLAGDDKGGIGFKRSIKAGNIRLKERKWFDTGLKMRDGTPRLVGAVDMLQCNEFIKKGWAVVEKGKGTSKKTKKR